MDGHQLASPVHQHLMLREIEDLRSSCSLHMQNLGLSQLTRSCWMGPFETAFLLALGTGKKVIHRYAPDEVKRKKKEKLKWICWAFPWLLMDWVVHVVSLTCKTEFPACLGNPPIAKSV